MQLTVALFIMVEGSVDVTKGTVVQLVQISDPHAHYHCEDMLWLECQIQCTQSTADIVECTQSTVLVYSVQIQCTQSNCGCSSNLSVTQIVMCSFKENSLFSFI